MTMDIELAMYAATSVLQSGDYKKETYTWEGRNANKKTWIEWKQAYLAAYAWSINRQRAGATDEPFTRAANNIMLAAPTDVIDALTGSLDNLGQDRPPTVNDGKPCTYHNCVYAHEPKLSLDSTYHQTYMVVMRDVVRDTEPPKPSGSITFGRMDTRPGGTPVQPALQRTGFQATMRA